MKWLSRTDQLSGAQIGLVGAVAFGFLFVGGLETSWVPAPFASPSFSPMVAGAATTPTSLPRSTPANLISSVVIDQWGVRLSAAHASALNYSIVNNTLTFSIKDGIPALAACRPFNLSLIRQSRRGSDADVLVNGWYYQLSGPGSACPAYATSFLPGRYGLTAR